MKAVTKSLSSWRTTVPEKFGMSASHRHAAAGVLEQAHHDVSVENDVALDQEDVLVALLAGVPQRANVVGRGERRCIHILDVDPGEVRPDPPADLGGFVADDDDGFGDPGGGQYPQTTRNRIGTPFTSTRHLGTSAVRG